ncbi:thrombospondin type 3 repeat-containing protein [Myxococcota bacterium]|nr:thrombospondin type 3 repeat-containing protein [Myxococcota bacterium]MBU1382709.1 thrombospondin type 3 repeat-containing protein [Myxococcota bacterium]MBU1496005.1 thrombospondin type 3 repeat-containing protein [Myxococcota bacterium]
MMAKFRNFIVFMAVMLYAQLSAAQAPQSDSLDVLTLRPAVGRGPFLYTSSLHMPAHMEYGAMMVFGFGMDPFVIYNMEGNNIGDVRAKLVSMIGMAELGGYLGLFDKYLVGLSVPVGFVQGNKVDDEGLETEGLNPMAWGDVTLHAKARFYKQNAINAGLDLRIGLPTGKYSDNFTGESGPTAALRALFMYDAGKFGAAVEAGFLFRLSASDSAFFNDKFEQGNQIVYGAGAWYQVIEKLKITAEITGRSGFSGAKHDHPVEGGIGAGYEVANGITVHAGFNMGVVAGVGTPLFRGIIGVKWNPNFKDSDNDGVPDTHDKCPFLKEDKDGFEDDDGCPDIDNDKDGIPDSKDKCPDKAEDIDGFEDEDGCPELDNDKDGIPDIQDQCPKAAGPKSNKGCPLSAIDSDGDGIYDDKDKCPNQAGESKYEGCTIDTYDGDGDGVMDSKDKCPKHKGEAKNHGCPLSMLDSDEDGVTDDKDKCPGKKETINGVDDDDGCPDKGKPWFTVSQSIKIMGMTKAGLEFKFPSRKDEWFKDGRGAELTDSGKKAIDQFVLFMKAMKAIPRMAIMINTDTTISSTEAYKVTQAQAETVKKYIISKGLPANRFAIQPLGSQMSLYKGNSRTKQKTNRRILFIILED